MKDFIGLTELSFKSFDDLKKLLVRICDNLDFWFDDKNGDGFQIIKRDGVYTLTESGFDEVYRNADVDEYINYLKKNFYDDISKYEWYFN